MLLNPSSFNITTLTSSSPLNEPGTFASSTSFPCSNCDADDAELLAHREAFNKAKKEKYVEMGYVVREDGYPIVPGLDASSCKSYSAECRFTYQDTFLAWDFLVDIDRATEVGVNVVDRWDMREKAVEGLLGIGPEEVVRSSLPSLPSLEVRCRRTALIRMKSPVFSSLPLPPCPPRLRY